MLHWFAPLKSCWFYHFFLSMLLFLLFLSCIHYYPTRNYLFIHSFIHPFTLVCACVLRCFIHVGLSATLWTVACQSPLFVWFSRQEHWSGLSCPPAGDLPDLEIKPMSVMSPALAGWFFTTSATWVWAKIHTRNWGYKNEENIISCMKKLRV